MSTDLAEKKCRACGEKKLKQSCRIGMRHQEKYYSGFTLLADCHECTKCGEVQ